MVAAALLTVLVCAASMLVYIIIPQPNLDILILGLDSREGEGWAGRTDSVMLLGIHPRGLNLSLFSIPRDVFIDTPGYGLQRVNTINVLGEMDARGSGPQLVKGAIAQSFGITPERYARINFQGFVNLIDAVGGVTIDVPRLIVDHNFPTEDFGVMTVRFEPGPQHMDGQRALIYARTRYSDDDYRRAERQQQVVTAVLGKLILPIYWPSALLVVADSVDTDLNPVDMIRAAPAILFGLGRMETLVLEREYLTATASGVVIPDYPLVQPWLDARFD